MKAVGIDPGYQCTGVVGLDCLKIVGKTTIRPRPMPWARLKKLEYELQTAELHRIQRHICQGVTEVLLVQVPDIIVLEWPGWYTRGFNTSILKLHKAVDAIIWAIHDCQSDKKLVVVNVADAHTRKLIPRKEEAQVKAAELWPDVKFNEHEADAAMLARFGLRYG